jgi:anaerobic ribonucleoside-triphosphate reductase
MAKANRTVPSETLSGDDLDYLTNQVVLGIEEQDTPGVEQIQDVVEKVLLDHQVYQTAKAYMVYRAEHTRRRETAHKLMETYRDISLQDAKNSDLKRENANMTAIRPWAPC